MPRAFRVRRQVTRDLEPGFCRVFFILRRLIKAPFTKPARNVFDGAIFANPLKAFF